MNTRVGPLPLPPTKIEKIIFYEDELLPVARTIFDEETLNRVNPKSVVRILTQDTIEERICNFQPKVYGKTLQGVHSLLYDVPLEIPITKDRRRSTSPPWQHSLCSEDELKNVEKLEKYIRDEDLELSNEIVSDTVSDYSNGDSPYISDIEDDIIDDLTDIEKYALRMLHLNNSKLTAPDIMNPPECQKVSPNYLPGSVIIDEIEDDLFISSTAGEETCVDQRGEILPVWTPPTPPRESSDDVKHRKEQLWTHNYDTNPMPINSAAMKRYKAENVVNQKSDYDLPISFFFRSGKVVNGTSRKVPVAKPTTQGQFSNQKWLIDEEWASLWSMEGTF